MTISLNHTIVPARDKRASAGFLAEILGLPVGEPVGPFIPVRIGELTTLDFADVDFATRGVGDIAPHHYAFAVSEDEFDRIFERIVKAGLDYYAEPHEPKRHGEINTWRGGRAVYFDDPDGHIMEVLTTPAE
ncbi:cysteine transferase [Sphaerisporangium melleum]|uniref:Cysteine transferase n=1 Tax=Sphaerisporangium melleum TaxID=321316 RepID=A0A917VG79_9ACTN|nr:VOC family protein [Sphaerisporangium melleum]GGK73657.1 cysteine transferase [Sphaerisporangium melleum]GII70815.1 cysteine transferase [Sphaerisporangium melleum]